MADTKISALSSASTPLAGTEVLPIVQSGATVKSTVSNLTAGRSVSMADVTASTGNVVVSTSGKGVTTGSAIPLGLGTNGSTSQVTVNTSGDTALTSTTQATSTTVASLTTAGGLGVAKKSFFGDAIQISGTNTISSGLVQYSRTKTGVANATLTSIATLGTGTGGMASGNIYVSAWRSAEGTASIFSFVCRPDDNGAVTQLSTINRGYGETFTVTLTLSGSNQLLKVQSANFSGTFTLCVSVVMNNPLGTIVDL